MNILNFCETDNFVEVDVTQLKLANSNNTIVKSIKDKMKTKFQLSSKRMTEDQKKYAVPARNLSDLPYVDIKSEKDFKMIPNTGGAYWIVTDEKIPHAMNKYHDNRVVLDAGEVIYNGMAKDDVRARIKAHLNRIDDKGMSAISVDILPYIAASHTKLMMHENNRKKLAYFNGIKITGIDDVILNQYSKSNQQNIKNVLNDPKNTNNAVWFRSGINVLDDNHSIYNWRVYYLTDVTRTYADFTECEWRRLYGQPRLNSYVDGR